MKACAIALVLASAALVAAAGQPAGRAAEGLTAIAGIKVGHHTLTERPTGCTVVLTEAGAIAGVDVRGPAPGTRETDLLAPGNLVDKVHAIVLSGGSAHGLDSATGVVQYLEEKKIGFEFGGAYVPIVPGAVLFDLPVGGKPLVRPGADCGYKAAQAATTGTIAEGNVGAGAGATVGKFGGAGRPMKGGIGTASITLPGGLIVAALVAVNSAGDVIDPATGQVVAGARTPDGKGFVDLRKALRSGRFAPPRPGENTTIGIVATNATLTDAQINRVASMAQAGLARAVVPSHTMVDGDAIFALATGAIAGEQNLSVIGALAADMVSEAILRAVRAATSIPGYPAVRDIK
ncbi:MAG: P1 family peptidase [Vicinamibacterales bacterium]